MLHSKFYCLPPSSTSQFSFFLEKSADKVEALHMQGKQVLPYERDIRTLNCSIHVSNAVIDLSLGNWKHENGEMKEEPGVTLPKKHKENRNRGKLSLNS